MKTIIVALALRHVYEVPVQLQATNTIQVRLEGKPGGHVFVLIDDPSASTQTAVSPHTK